MKIKTAISIADSFRRGNQIDIAAKRRWLANLDGKIYEYIILGHEGEERDKQPLLEDYLHSELDLLVHDAHSELYIWYLISQIDSTLGETEKYNISAERFNRLYSEYVSWYNRTHRPCNLPQLRNVMKVGGI